MAEPVRARRLSDEEGRRLQQIYPTVTCTFRMDAHCARFAPREKLRDVCFGEDASRVSRAHQAKAAIRNTIIGILHLHRIPNIAAQLRSCHRDPYRLPLQLLGLTRPQVPPTGNHAVT